MHTVDHDTDTHIGRAMTVVADAYTAYCRRMTDMWALDPNDRHAELWAQAHAERAAASRWLIAEACYIADLPTPRHAFVPTRNIVLERMEARA